MINSRIEIDLIAFDKLLYKLIFFGPQGRVCVCILMNSFLGRSVFFKKGTNECVERNKKM